MSKPRKKWEPAYRFGGNPASAYQPKPLGENESPYLFNKRTKGKKGSRR